MNHRCPSCGRESGEREKYCGSCGAFLRAVSLRPIAVLEVGGALSVALDIEVPPGLQSLKVDRIAVADREHACVWTMTARERPWSGVHQVPDFSDSSAEVKTVPVSISGEQHLNNGQTLRFEYRSELPVVSDRARIRCVRLLRVGRRDSHQELTVADGPLETKGEVDGFRFVVATSVGTRMPLEFELELIENPQPLEIAKIRLESDKADSVRLTPPPLPIRNTVRIPLTSWLEFTATGPGNTLEPQQANLVLTLLDPYEPERHRDLRLPLTIHVLGPDRCERYALGLDLGSGRITASALPEATSEATGAPTACKLANSSEVRGLPHEDVAMESLPAIQVKTRACDGAHDAPWFPVSSCRMGHSVAGLEARFLDHDLLQALLQAPPSRQASVRGRLRRLAIMALTRSMESLSNKQVVGSGTSVKVASIGSLAVAVPDVLPGWVTQAVAEECRSAAQYLGIMPVDGLVAPVDASWAACVGLDGGGGRRKPAGGVASATTWAVFDVGASFSSVGVYHREAGGGWTCLAKTGEVGGLTAVLGGLKDIEALGRMIGQELAAFALEPLLGVLRTPEVPEEAMNPGAAWRVREESVRAMEEWAARMVSDLRRSFKWDTKEGVGKVFVAVTGCGAAWEVFDLSRQRRLRAVEAVSHHLKHVFPSWSIEEGQVPDPKRCVADGLAILARQGSLARWPGERDFREISLRAKGGTGNRSVHLWGPGVTTPEEVRLTDQEPGPYDIVARIGLGPNEVVGRAVLSGPGRYLVRRRGGLGMVLEPAKGPEVGGR